MKNLFKFMLLAAVVVAGACDNEGDLAKNPERIFSSYFNDLMNESETLGLNPEEFPATLYGKTWSCSALVKYDQEWENPEVIYATIDGTVIVPEAPGMGGDSYSFNNGGTGQCRSSSYGGFATTTWSWDPTTMTLRIEVTDSPLAGKTETMQIQVFTPNSFVAYQEIVFIDTKSGEKRPCIYQSLYTGH